MKVTVLATSTLLCVVVVATSPARGDLQQAIQTLRQTGPNGKGAAEAAKAWRQLADAHVDRLVLLLSGMDGANPVAQNWLRSALDRIIDRARKDRTPLPAAALESFLRDREHDPKARRLAYELILEGDRAAADRFLPNMLDDPSPELRRDAVARVLDLAQKEFDAQKKAEALTLFQQSLTSARDKDQIDKAASKLKDLGHPVDLATHLGFIMDWKVIGPFPNEKQKGPATIYPPERSIDLAGEYDGKKGKVRWQPFVTKSPSGIVDVYEPLGKHVDATAYAIAEFTSAEARNVEVRLGCVTAFKLWVNGELLLDRGDAYTGMSMDHYVAKAHLNAGKNVILLKSCLDDPPPPLPKSWKFMLRVCDETGLAVLSTTRPPNAPPPPEKKS